MPFLVGKLAYFVNPQSRIIAATRDSPCAISLYRSDLPQRSASGQASMSSLMLTSKVRSSARSFGLANLLWQLATNFATGYVCPALQPSRRFREARDQFPRCLELLEVKAPEVGDIPAVAIGKRW